MNKVREFLDKCGKILEENAVPQDISNSSPEELHIELTFRCNTDCVMCNLRYINKPENELTAAQWMETIRNSKLLKGIRFIVLSGGEPWLKEGFIEIVEFLRRCYPQVNILILSNLIDEKLALDNIEKIKGSIGLKNISLGSSLDGIGPAHDKIRGRKGSFDMLSNTLKLIKDKYPELYFSLNFTLTPENCDQIVPVFDWCAEKGYHVSFQVMVQKKETREFKWNRELIGIVSAQLDELTDKMMAKNASRAKNFTALLANEGLLSLLTSIHYIEKYILEHKRYFPNCPCGAKYAMIDPYGNLYFCPVHKDMTAGNVKVDLLDNLWTSNKSGQLKDFFNTKACHCWLTCTNGYMIGDAISSGKDKLVKSVFSENGD